MVIQIILIIAVHLRAVYTDLKENIIENRVLLAAYVTGIFVNLITGRQEALLQGLKMSFLVTAVLFLLFLIKGIGGGDVKLLGVTGLYLPAQIIKIAVLSFPIAAAIAVGRMVVRKIKGQRVLVVGDKLHFSLPIMLSTLCVLVCRL